MAMLRVADLIAALDEAGIPLEDFFKKAWSMPDDRRKALAVPLLKDTVAAAKALKPGSKQRTGPDGHVDVDEDVDGSVRE